MTELKVKPDVARMFEGLRIASDEEIARYEAREKHAARSQRLASCGIDVTDEERALVLGGRLRKTKPIEIVQKWHSTAPVAGCTLASLEDASNGILVLAGGMGTGKTISAAWWLSHAPGRYLSIIDLAGSSQPMASADGRCHLTFNGETLPLSEWAERTGIGYTTLRRRVRVWGWTHERALTEKDGRRNPARIHVENGTATVIGGAL
jgi:hypothetical protein